MRLSYELKERQSLNSYKDHIPLVRRDNLCTLSNFLIIEICSNNENYFVTCRCIFRSSSWQHKPATSLMLNCNWRF